MTEEQEQRSQTVLETEQNIQFIANMLIQWSVYSSNYKISSCDALFPLWCSDSRHGSRTLVSESHNTFVALYKPSVILAPDHSVSLQHHFHRLKDTNSKDYLHSCPPLTHEWGECWGVGGATRVALEPHWFPPSIFRKTLAPNIRNK